MKASEAIGTGIFLCVKGIENLLPPVYTDYTSVVNKSILCVLGTRSYRLEVEPCVVAKFPPPCVAAVILTEVDF